MLFAVTDIETTGGYASSHGITEIGVVIHDGQEIIRRFETLINPHQNIPYPIQKLTGITNEMVHLAPSFEEIAAELFELLQGKIFVAHNVNFDYSFLHHQLGALGYHLQCQKLCTVRYARKVSPKLASYSLGKLCAHFEIPVYNRHRAGGDAAATAELLKLLLKKDVNNHLYTMLKRQSKEQMLPVNLGREQIDELPLTPGVYYFHDAKDKIIYVGKAKMLRKRVVGHFSGNKPSLQRQEFLRTIHRISYQQCGTELMASVLETIEIKRLWPRYNRATKGFEAGYGLYLFEDGNGYLRLAVDRKHKNLQAVQIYFSRMEAMNELKRLAKEYSLCHKLCFIDRSHDDQCSNENCKGACVQEETAIDYNERVVTATKQLKQELPSFAIRERSYFNNSDACILMEDGKFYGMGYVPVDFDFSNGNDLKHRLQSYPEYQLVRSLINRYAMEQPETVNWLQ
ncbi:MAG: GIY-YIG nuclease family protein [Chitinophagaceae bacterium]|nr:GIY-YIG nuclease family protein [Chitinophagaceae bacterium]